MYSPLEKLKPASKGEVMLYTPYYSKNQHSWLPYAISLYKQGSLEGKRKIEGNEGIPFVASWYVSKLPADLTRCQIQFNGQGELSYQVSMSNHEFINYLIDVYIKFRRDRSADFPNQFYRKLLQIEG